MPKLDLASAKQIKTSSGEILSLKGQGFSWVKPSASVGRVDMNVKTLGFAVPYNELSAGGTAWLDSIAASGAKVLRFDFYFDQIQPTQGGAYTWSSIDSMVDAALARGIQVLGILTGVRAGGGQTYATTADRNAFAAFAGAAADRYKGRVDHWAVFNEPNHGKMTAANYVELLKVTSPAIRAANPDAFITGPNMSSEPNATSGLYTNNADFLNALYDGGCQPHFDAIGFHPYTYPWWPDEPDAHIGWNQLKNVIRPLMVSRGDGAKKIWLTEVGYPSGPTAVDEWYTEAYQAEVFDLYVNEYKTLPYVGPMFWYSWQDRPGQAGTEDFFGVRRPNGVNKPAYTSFSQQAATFPPLSTPVTPPVDPLLHVFPLNEGSGTTFASNTGRSASILGTPNWQTSPARLTFTNQIATTPATAAMHTDPIMFGAVVRFSANTATAKQIFARDQPQAGGRFFQLMNINGAYGITIFNESAVSTHKTIASQFTANTWVMVTALFGFSGVLMRKNGVLLSDLTFTGRRTTTHATPITIGGRYATTGSGYAETMNNDSIAALAIKESAVEADFATMEAQLRSIATSKGITLP